MLKSPIRVVRHSVVRPQLDIVGKSVMSPFHRGSMQLSIPTYRIVTHSYCGWWDGLLGLLWLTDNMTTIDKVQQSPVHIPLDILYMYLSCHSHSEFVTDCLRWGRWIDTRISMDIWQLKVDVCQQQIVHCLYIDLELHRCRDSDRI